MAAEHAFNVEQAMMERPPRGPVKVSEEFMAAFRAPIAGCSRMCHCGRTHFDNSDNMWDWNDGELEELQARHNDDPDLCVAHDHAIGCYVIDGKEYVLDCPCQGGASIEKWIIRHSHAIAAFLNARVERLKREAEAAPTVKLSEEPE